LIRRTPVPSAHDLLHPPNNDDPRDSGTLPYPNETDRIEVAHLGPEESMLAFAEAGPSKK
jgi:hypothetical protein